METVDIDVLKKILKIKNGMQTAKVFLRNLSNLNMFYSDENKTWKRLIIKLET